MKHLRYLRYIIRHKWFVLRAGIKLKVPLWRLLIHDWTKFLPSEWFAYADFFYGDERAKVGAEISFKYAWNHHQKANPHHWEYWVLVDQDMPLQMPDTYVREMVADWAGAGRGINGGWDVSIWYEKHRNHIRLHSYTQQEVESYIKRFLPKEIVE